MTLSDPEAARSGNSKITTTLGLVVHAAGNVGPTVKTQGRLPLLCSLSLGGIEIFVFWF